MKMKDLALAQVRRGERFTLDGVEFVKLEDDLDTTFAVTADTLPECCQFEDDDAEREDHNNYAGSLLSKTVERWLRDKHLLCKCRWKHPAWSRSSPTAAQSLQKTAARFW